MANRRSDKMLSLFERGSQYLVLTIVQKVVTTYELHVQHVDGTRTLEFLGVAERLVEEAHAVPQALIAAGWHLRLMLELDPSARPPESNAKL